ncbi:MULTISPECIES: tyrosine-protein kinase domain-containing protein [unclassified Leptolyngbya]|uniref:GumC family protein n=1 Tax=unclassified Leptolyngbya TaxID=2650499 RepID=UPI0016890704|nr:MULTISPECIES: tyrosine-protein kinase domain-containing protein [unclassified Leptolyngbya]MBD1912801.1 polysaccharide biosynthesis tyrosine autokinase [Leptolyngbya sp. FACHB-8]MBD2157748.1 polysaccharide biosynthesis tyrosine autokinase [Leptolyngbya sp. FACHB-16]
MVKELDLLDEDSLEPLEVSSTPKQGLPIFPLIRMLLRRWPIIVGLAGATTAAAWMSTSADPTVYSGNFRLLVEPVTSEARIAEPTSLSRTAGGVPSQDMFRLDYPTQIEILRSPQVLQDVYEAVHAKHPEFTYFALTQGLTVARAGGKTQESQTRILDVSYQGTNPEVVQDVLNQVRDKYLNYSLQDRKSRIGEGVKFIDDQLPDLETRVNALEEEIQSLQQDYDLLDPTSQGQDLNTRLQDIGNRQLETQQTLQETRTLYTALQRQLQLTPDEAIAVAAISQDPRYQQLLTNMNDLEAQLATERARWSDEAPPVQRLLERRDNLYNLLSQRSQQILGGLAQVDQNTELTTFQDDVRLGLIDQLVETTNQLQVLEVRNRILAQNRVAVEQQVQQFPEISRRYIELQRQLQIATQTLNQLQSQRESLRVAAAQNEVPWEVIAEPQVPKDEFGNAIGTPSSNMKALAAGAAAGLALGLGLSILIERKQDTFYDVDDVKDLVPAPRLGIIPVCTDGDPSLQLVTISHSNGQIEELSQGSFDFQEAFETLHTNLRFLHSTSPVRSLVVCSATPGDGKTTTSLHLARAAAATGQRVLLVDTNLRSPQVHRKLRLSNNRGLSDILRRKASHDEVIQSAPEVENLDVLTTGPVTSGLTRLMASPQMKGLMGKLESLYDLVIYDSPNLVEAVDANFIAANADGILMVVSVRQTSRSKVAQSIKKIKEYDLPLLGTVANRASKPVRENIPRWDEDEDDSPEELLLPASESSPVYSQISAKQTAYVRDSES